MRRPSTEPAAEGGETASFGDFASDSFTQGVNV